MPDMTKGVFWIAQAKVKRNYACVLRAYVFEKLTRFMIHVFFGEQNYIR